MGLGAFIYQQQLHRLYTSGLIESADYIHFGVNGDQELFNVPEKAIVKVNQDWKEETETMIALKDFAYENPENLYANLYGCKGSIVTGMWSFDKLLFGDVMEVLQKSFEYMEKAIQYTCGIDIEHSLYHFIDRNNILNVDTLGVNVVKGMSKEIYSL